MGDVEDLVDERRQAAGGLVDPLDVVALLGRVELEVEERLGVAADERQRRPQLVADGRDEPFAQLLERPDGADVAQDRGRPDVAAAPTGARTAIAAGDAGPAARRRRGPPSRGRRSAAGRR